MITITHTHAGGTLLEGSAKGDGVWEILKGLRDNWRYFPSIRAIGIGQSRDRNADTYKINRAAEALRAAGHDVAVTVDEGERRDMATIETERAERAEARAERYEERAGRVGQQAQADYGRARQMAEAIPFGQPMMPDHYSYNRDRRYRDRIHSTFGRAFAGMDEAKELGRRAGAAEANQAHRESVPATLRRIAKLEADERRIQRTIAGRDEYVLNEATGEYDIKLVTPGPRYLARLESSLAEVREQLAYWRGHVKAAEADGVKVWGPADFTKGDFVRTRYGWAEVLRVNAKSVSIPWNVSHRGEVITRADGHYPRPWPYDEVCGRKSADDLAALLAEAEQHEQAS
jgi:Domain of unknown function (DUF3560)